MIKVGINGFGRIGRFVFRAAQKRNDIQIVGINDLCPVDYLAYMLKYDTMHGQFDGTIEADVENSKLIVNGNATFHHIPPPHCLQTLPYSHIFKSSSGNIVPCISPVQSS